MINISHKVSSMPWLGFTPILPIRLVILASWLSAANATLTNCDSVDSTYNTCLRCSNGHFLDPFQSYTCVVTCSPGQYSDQATNQCLPCHGTVSASEYTCAKCEGDQAGQCLEVPPGYCKTKSSTSDCIEDTTTPALSIPCNSDTLSSIIHSCVKCKSAQSNSCLIAADGYCKAETSTGLCNTDSTTTLPVQKCYKTKTNVANSCKLCQYAGTKTKCLVAASGFCKALSSTPGTDCNSDTTTPLSAELCTGNNEDHVPAIYCKRCSKVGHPTDYSTSTCLEATVGHCLSTDSNNCVASGPAKILPCAGSVVGILFTPLGTVVQSVTTLGCKTCTTTADVSPTLGCSSCPDGRYLTSSVPSQAECKACPSYCATCTSASKCESCVENARMDQNGLCQCTASGTNGNGNVCRRTLEPECPSECLSCSGSSCTSCKLPFSPTNGTCSQCLNSTDCSSFAPYCLLDTTSGVNKCFLLQNITGTSCVDTSTRTVLQCAEGYVCFKSALADQPTCSSISKLGVTSIVTVEGNALKLANASAISTHAKIYDGVTINGDASIWYGSVIRMGAVVSKGVIVTENVVVDEHVRIEEGVHAGAHTSIGKHSTLGKNSRLSDNTTLGEHVVIGASCDIGQRCQISSYSHIGDKTTIGEDVVIHYNVSIGSNFTSRSLLSIISRDSSLTLSSNIGTKVTIGNETVFSGSVTLIGYNSFGAKNSIGNNFLAQNNTSMGDGNIIGDGCILAGNITNNRVYSKNTIIRSEEDADNSRSTKLHSYAFLLNVCCVFFCVLLL
eukprot:Nk52_evm5s564 gene=Nk52_evmTU5s564